MDSAQQTASSSPCSKPKRERASVVKVRTGCITCKKRHVKCDETKPHCTNCLRARGHCQGYAPRKPSKNASAVPVQICWDSREFKPQPPPRQASLQLQRQINPDSVDFRDDSALLYFDEFVALAQGPWINASSGNDLWRVTLPQLARSNDVLRSAAVAIGALSTWHGRSGSRSLRAAPAPAPAPASPKGEHGAHYLHAVAYYCRSIQLQRQSASPEDALFLSLLLLLFESLRGDGRAALDHVNHGLTLLLTLLAEDDHVSSRNHLFVAVADIFAHLATQVRTILRGRMGQGPSLPHLARQLRRQRCTMESFMLRLSRLPRPVATMAQIPTVFNSLDEFEGHWAAGRRRHTKMIAIVAESMQDSSTGDSKDNDSIDGFFLTLLGNPRIQAFCADSRKEMQALDAAFLPLFNNITTMYGVTSPAYLRAVHLRLQYLASYAIEDPTRFLDADTLAAQTPLFREYLSLAATALRTAARGESGGVTTTTTTTTNPAHQLSLQGSLAWHLLSVALFCRDAATRDEAVRMLRGYGGQDGLWDTRSLYVLARRNRDVERMNALAGGTAGEQWRRLWRREFVFEDGGRGIVLRYLELDGEMGEEWRLVEEVARVGAAEHEEVRWVRRDVTASKSGLLMGDLYSPDSDH